MCTNIVWRPVFIIVQRSAAGSTLSQMILSISNNILLVVKYNLTCCGCVCWLSWINLALEKHGDKTRLFWIEISEIWMMTLPARNSRHHLYYSSHADPMENMLRAHTLKSKSSYNINQYPLVAPNQNNRVAGSRWVILLTNWIDMKHRLAWVSYCLTVLFNVCSETSWRISFGWQGF